MYRLILLWLVLTAAYLIGRYHRINKRPRPHAGLTPQRSVKVT